MSTDSDETSKHKDARRAEIGNLFILDKWVFPSLQIDGMAARWTFCTWISISDQNNTRSFTRTSVLYIDNLILLLERRSLFTHFSETSPRSFRNFLSSVQELPLIRSETFAHSCRNIYLLHLLNSSIPSALLPLDLFDLDRPIFELAHGRSKYCQLHLLPITDFTRLDPPRAIQTPAACHEYRF